MKRDWVEDVPGYLFGGFIILAMVLSAALSIGFVVVVWTLIVKFLF